MTRPLLVLLPGFDGTGQLFASLVEALGPDWEVLLQNYPALDSPDSYVEHIEARLPRDRALVLVAESFSGPIALELLSRGNADYVGAVLSTTFARPPLGLVLSIAHKMRLATFVNPSINEQILRLFCLNGVSDIALIKDIVHVVRRIDSQVVSARLRTLTQLDASLALSHIATPTLVFTAAHDRLVRRRFSESLLSELPAVTHQEIRGPHLLLQASAGTCAQHLAEFAEACVSTAS